MILEHPIKGGIIEAKPLISSNNKRYKPCLRIIDKNGDTYYLSWENLTKALNIVGFDVDKKRVRKHLIPVDEISIQS
jgi:hypothetical protein